MLLYNTHLYIVKWKKKCSLLENCNSICCFLWYVKWFSSIIFFIFIVTERYLVICLHLEQHSKHFPCTCTIFYLEMRKNQLPSKQWVNTLVLYSFRLKLTLVRHVTITYVLLHIMIIVQKMFKQHVDLWFSLLQINIYSYISQ